MTNDELPEPGFIEKVQQMLHAVRATWQTLASDAQDGTAYLKEPARFYLYDSGEQNGILTVKFSPSEGLAR
jgi:hypothetical protein